MDAEGYSNSRCIGVCFSVYRASYKDNSNLTQVSHNKSQQSTALRRSEKKE